MNDKKQAINLDENKDPERLRSKMEIIEYTVEKIVDPTNILSGDRYEFKLYAMLSEDDELYAKDGVGIRVIFVVDGEDERVGTAHFFERETDAVYDFELSEEELESVFDFCQRNFEYAE